MSGSGRVHCETGARINATCDGGIGVVRGLVARAGVAGATDKRLNLLERHRPYHESDHAVDVACNVLGAGIRPEGINSRRSAHDVACMEALGAEDPEPDSGGRLHAPPRRVLQGDPSERRPKTC